MLYLFIKYKLKYKHIIYNKVYIPIFQNQQYINNQNLKLT